MAVIIENMDFPKRCLDCQLLGREKMYCQLYPRKDLNVIRVVSEKPDWCPLKEVPTGKWITTKQLEDMYNSYEKSLWREREDIRGDDMVLLCDAQTFLQEELSLLGCWDDEVEKQQGKNVNENNMS